MRTVVALLASAFAAACAPGEPGRTSNSEERAMIQQLTPVLVVDDVGPSMAFFTDRLGFEVKMQAPDETGAVFFAAVERDGREIMLQTRASADAGPMGPVNFGVTVLYIEVADFEAVAAKLDGADVVVADHVAPYGSREMYVREPGGHIVGVAQPGG